MRHPVRQGELTRAVNPPGTHLGGGRIQEEALMPRYLKAVLVTDQYGETQYQCETCKAGDTGDADHRAAVDDGYLYICGTCGRSIEMKSRRASKKRR